MTEPASHRLYDALVRWPLDREQWSFIHEVIVGINEDQVASLLVLFEEAESAVMDCAGLLMRTHDTELTSEHQEGSVKDETQPTKMWFRPLGDRVVVRPIEAEHRTAGGIIIPDTTRAKPLEGEVIAVGPGAVDDTGQLRLPIVKAGDRVLFGKWSATEVTVDGRELLIMKESDLLGVIEPVQRRAKGAA